LNFQVLEHNKHRACNFDIYFRWYVQFIGNFYFSSVNGLCLYSVTGKSRQEREAVASPQEPEVEATMLVKSDSGKYKLRFFYQLITD